MLTPEIQNKMNNFTSKNPFLFKKNSILSNKQFMNNGLLDISENNIFGKDSILLHHDFDLNSHKEQNSISNFKLFPDEDNIRNNEKESPKHLEDIQENPQKNIFKNLLSKRDFEESNLQSKKSISKIRKRKNADYHKVIKNLSFCVDSLKSNPDFFSLISQNPFSKLLKISEKLESNFV